MTQEHQLYRYFDSYRMTLSAKLCLSANHKQLCGSNNNYKWGYKFSKLEILLNVQLLGNGVTTPGELPPFLGKVVEWWITGNWAFSHLMSQLLYAQEKYIHGQWFLFFQGLQMGFFTISWWYTFSVLRVTEWIRKLISRVFRWNWKLLQKNGNNVQLEAINVGLIPNPILLSLWVHWELLLVCSPTLVLWQQ